jgi:hypothetical protein
MSTIKVRTPVVPKSTAANKGRLVMEGSLIDPSQIIEQEGCKDDDDY